MNEENFDWKNINLRPLDVCKKHKPRILYICSWYREGSGLSSAINDQIQNLDHNDKYSIVALRVWEHDKELNIVQYNSNKLRKLLQSKFDLIHYYLGQPSKILEYVIEDMKAVGIKLPILCTVCQSPSYRNMLISPYEYHHVDHFVFIDKTSYANPLISFVPKDRRSQIYLTRPGELDKMTESFPIKEPEKDIVIFGRGTTLSKCPKNMFEVWDRINVPGKILHIAGVPKENNWVYREAQKRKNVIFHGFLPYEKWVEVCNSWDIVLYQIPRNSHASLDANLGLGMLLRKPTVYLGVGAGEERFINGINGFVAKNEDEMVEYAERLAKDLNLRRQIGLEARKTTIEHMKNAQCDQKYDYIYQKLLSSPPSSSIHVPMKYWVYYLRKSWRRIIKSWLGVRNKKDLFFWKPKTPDV